MKIINKYILKEFLPQFLLGLLVFTFILIMERIFYLTNLIVSKGVSVFKVIQMFSYILPSFASMTLPMSFLMGTLLAFGRLQDDNEIIALRAGGVSQIKIIIPILLISLIFSGFMIFFNQNIVPNAQKKFSKIYYNIAYQKPTLKFEEKTFFTLQNYKLYIKKINRKTNSMKDLIIYKTENHKYPTLITAKTGKLIQKTNSIKMKLFNGMIQQKNDKDPREFNQLYFKEYDINFDLKDAQKKIHDYSKSTINLTANEIKKEIVNLKSQNINAINLKIQYHQRFTMAIACFIFTLLASSLAIMSTKHTKSIAFGLSLILIFVFYALLTFSAGVAEKKLLTPAIALSLPNIILGIIGVILSLRVNKK
ncbi:MAG: YjgP/YjgQ family permease [bacterium]|nr:YjgP/YjgQ family permease [bacterium]